MKIKIHRRRDYKEFLTIMKDFDEKSGSSEEIKSRHERFTVLKQMCANSAVAIFFSGIMIFIRSYIKLQSWWSLIIPVSSTIISIFLLKAYKHQLDQQEIWEDLYAKRGENE